MTLRHNSVVFVFFLAFSCQLDAYMNTLETCILPPIQVNDFTCGGVVEKSLTVSAPSIRFTRAVLGCTYTLLMVDPDAPTQSCPASSFIKHWIVANISACSLHKGSANIESEPGVTVHRSYLNPRPPMGVHRYQLLVFEEPNPCPSGNCAVVDTKPNEIRLFDVKAFVAKNNLKAVGGFEYRVDSKAPENCTAYAG